MTGVEDLADVMPGSCVRRGRDGAEQSATFASVDPGGPAPRTPRRAGRARRRAAPRRAPPTRRRRVGRHLSLQRDRLLAAALLRRRARRTAERRSLSASRDFGDYDEPRRGGGACARAWASRTSRGVGAGLRRRRAAPRRAPSTGPSADSSAIATLALARLARGTSPSRSAAPVATTCSRATTATAPTACAGRCGSSRPRCWSASRAARCPRRRAQHDGHARALRRGPRGGRAADDASPVPGAPRDPRAGRRVRHVRGDRVPAAAAALRGASACANGGRSRPRQLQRHDSPTTCRRPARQGGPRHDGLRRRGASPAARRRAAPRREGPRPPEASLWSGKRLLRELARGGWRRCPARSQARVRGSAEPSSPVPGARTRSTGCTPDSTLVDGPRAAALVTQTPSVASDVWAVVALAAWERRLRDARAVARSGR